MPLPTQNTLDYIKGTYPYFQLAPYVSAGVEASSFIDIGSMSDVSVDTEGTVNELVVDTCPFPVDAWISSVKATIKGTLHEADARKLAIVLNQYDAGLGGFADPDNPEITARVGGTTDGTMVTRVGMPTLAYWQVKLTLDDQSFKSVLPSGDTYTKRYYNIWKVMIVPKTAHTFKPTDHVKTGFEMRVLYDSSVATDDKLYKITDFLAK